MNAARSFVIELALGTTQTLISAKGDNMDSPSVARILIEAVNNYICYFTLTQMSIFPIGHGLYILFHLYRKVYHSPALCSLEYLG